MDDKKEKPEDESSKKGEITEETHEDQDVSVEVEEIFVEIEEEFLEKINSDEGNRGKEDPLTNMFGGGAPKRFETIAEIEQKKIEQMMAQNVKKMSETNETPEKEKKADIVQQIEDEQAEVAKTVAKVLAGTGGNEKKTDISTEKTASSTEKNVEKNKKETTAKLPEKDEKISGEKKAEQPFKSGKESGKTVQKEGRPEGKNPPMKPGNPPKKPNKPPVPPQKSANYPTQGQNQQRKPGKPPMAKGNPYDVKKEAEEEAQRPDLTEKLKNKFSEFGRTLEKEKKLAERPEKTEKIQKSEKITKMEPPEHKVSRPEKVEKPEKKPSTQPTEKDESDLDLEQMDGVDQVVSPLAAVFFTTILFMFTLNLANLQSSFAEAKEEHPEDTQAAYRETESLFAENFISKETFIELNSTLAAPLEQVELNDVVKLYNGYLTTLDEEIPDEELQVLADHMVEFHEYLDEEGIPFAFVQVPHKLPSDSDVMLPSGYDTYPNRNADAFIAKLEAEKVPVLDLRSEMLEDGLNPFDYYFKTDHHWTPLAGFWAHGKIGLFVDTLTRRSEFNDDYYDLKNYEVEEYPDFWIGSHGKRTGEAFSGMDGMALVYPDFETDMRVEMQEINWSKRGTFEHAVFNRSKLTENPYGVYLTSDLRTSISNYNATNDTTILIIKDSFSLAMAPFLALHYQNVELYDLRLPTSSPTELLAVIEEVEPDVVLCMYNPTLLYSESHIFLPEHVPPDLDEEPVVQLEETEEEWDEAWEDEWDEEWEEEWTEEWDEEWEE